MTINLMLHGAAVPVERRIFEVLFGDSVVRDYAAIRDALDTGRIPFATFVEMARKAEIPYPLFLAPADVVEEQIRIKTSKLMAGFTKKSFSMNSRNRVRISDVELIVKDLLRKQQYLKADETLTKNVIVGCLKRSNGSVREDASRLTTTLGFTVADLRGAKNKQAALDLLIERLEANQVLVSRSARLYMPQMMPRGLRFSGMTIKDSKVPYIFLASGDEGDGSEPTGRKVFTLTLLAVLVARGTFAPVTYNGHTAKKTAPREYELVAQILMPEAEFRSLDLASLDDVKSVADLYKVTPSAVVVRARRLGLFDRDTTEEYLDELDTEYAARTAEPKRNALPVNALRNYNGAECSRRMLALLDGGQIKPTEFCRIMFANKLKRTQIPDFRAAVT